jgi:hypothetical protein
MRNFLWTLLLTANVLFCSAQTAQWSDLNTGGSAFKTGEVLTLYSNADNSLYIGTDFKSLVASKDSLGRLFQWNGTALAELESFPYHQQGIAITHLTGDKNGNVYVAGYYTNETYSSKHHNFSHTAFIYQWDGRKWQSLLHVNEKFATNAYVEALCVDSKGSLYAIGSAFTKTDHRYLAKWTGSGWVEVGNRKSALHMENAGYQSLCADTVGNVYVSGALIGHNTKTNVYRWDGESWAILGDQMHALNADKDILSIAVDKNGTVYAAGAFENADKSHYVAQWDGTKWNELGTGTSALNANSIIYTLCFDKDGSLYAAGSFTNKDKHKYVAKWDGKTWSELGGTDALQANQDILTLTVDSQGRVYAGGRFTDKNGKHYVATFKP